MCETLHSNRFFTTLWILVMLFVNQSKAQSTWDNPFDIGIVAPINSDSLQESAIIDTVLVSQNPFDIVNENLKNTKAKSNTISSKIPAIQKIASNNKPQGFLFSLVLGVLFLLTFLVSISRSLISKIYQAFFNDIVLKMLFRSRSSLSSTVYIALYAMFMINLSIFIYLILRYNGWLINQSDVQTLLTCIVAIIVLIIAKHIVLAILSYVFPISKEIDLYSFIIMVFGVLMGLLLAPVNVFFAYADGQVARIIIIGMAIVLGIVYTLKAIRSLLLVRNVIFSNFLHFLLYLCAIEIVPIILLLKIINTKLEIPILSAVM